MRTLLLALTIGWIIITGRGKSYRNIRLAVFTLALILVLGLRFEHNRTLLAFTNKLISYTSAHIHWLVLILVGLLVLNQLFKNRSSFSHTKAW